MHTSSAHRTFPALIKFDFVLLKIVFNVSSTNSEQSKLCINVQRTIDNKPETLSVYVEKSRWLEHFRIELITNWHIQSTIKKIRNKNVATKQTKHKIKESCTLWISNATLFYTNKKQKTLFP